jgi:hypothetical protein
VAESSFLIAHGSHHVLCTDSSWSPVYLVDVRLKSNEYVKRHCLWNLHFELDDDYDGGDIWIAAQFVWASFRGECVVEPVGYLAFDAQNGVLQTWQRRTSWDITPVRDEDRDHDYGRKGDYSFELTSEPPPSLRHIVVAETLHERHVVRARKVHPAHTPLFDLHRLYGDDQDLWTLVPF